MPKDNKKEFDKSSSGSHGLSDSPYIGGRKMSTSLKDKSKYFKRCNIPFSKPPASNVHVRSILFQKFGREYSKEEIEDAMNAPEPKIDEGACSSPQVIEVITISDEENEISSLAPKKDLHKKVGSDLNEFVEGSVEVSCPEENGTDTSFLNDVDKSGAKINVNSFTKESFINGKDGYDFKINDEASSSSSDKIDNCMDAFKVNEVMCAHSKEDIEKCVNKESMFEIFHDLQKKYAENQEKLGKLRLVQKHHTKNTKLALRKLYDFMPEPRITFEDFLIFMDMDFKTVKYNPETIYVYKISDLKKL